jgi:hypothetical protein
MTKKEMASGRNWQKARILGSVVNTKYLTRNEVLIIRFIAGLKMQLLKNWETNSSRLGLKVIRYNLVVEGKIVKSKLTYKNAVMFRGAYVGTSKNTKIIPINQR